MKYNTLKKRDRKEFENKPKEEKLKKMRAHLEMLRTSIKTDERKIKEANKRIRKNREEAQEVLEMLQNKDFKGFKSKVYTI